MNKSLTPLIVSFAVIILLTLIVIHSNSKRGEVPDTMVFDLAPALRLGSYPGQKRSAREQTSREPDLSPDSARLLDDARQLLAQGQKSEAEDRLRTILVFSPDHMSALSLLGGILFYSSRYDEAEMIYRKQLSLDPENASLYNNLGSVLARQERYDEAIASSDKAVELNPESSAAAHVNLAGMHAVIGNRDQAMDHLNLAYEQLGGRILPFTEDPAFRNLRNDPDFQILLSRARLDWQQQQNAEKQESPAEP